MRRLASALSAGKLASRKRVSKKAHSLGGAFFKFRQAGTYESESKLSHSQNGVSQELNNQGKRPYPAFRRAALGWVCLLVLALSGTLNAADTGRVHCYVFEGGGPLPGAMVGIDGEKEMTGPEGASRFRLSPGAYDLVVEAEGFAPAKAVVPVAEGEVTEVIVTMAPPGKRPSVRIESPVNTPSEQEEEVMTGKEKGIISGKVLDLENKRPVSDAGIYVRGFDAQAVTAADGAFSVQLPAGDYSLSVIHPDYSTQTVDDIKVRPDEKTGLTIEVTPSAFELEEYTVTAPKIEGGVASLSEERRESASVTDVIGAEQMSKSGDSNAAAALRRVTGLTVMGGRYVYVRGMGERYSSSLLNDSTLPSPEPERRVVPLDIFPAEIIESVVIQKTYSPDLPAGFGGGAVKIRTRGMPEKLMGTVSVSIGYNNRTSFKEGPMYEGGDLDWLGYDDGTRALPDEVQKASDDRLILPRDAFSNRGYTAEELEEFGEAMPNIWNSEKKEIPMNFGFSANVGNKYMLWENPAGFLFAITYDNSWQRYQKDRDIYVTGKKGELALRHSYEFDTLTHHVVLGGIFDTSVEFSENHRLQSTSLLIRTTEDMARMYEGWNSDAGTDIRVTRLRWVEQMLASQQLSGNHAFPSLYDLRLDWSYTYSLAGRKEPDRRETRYDWSSQSKTWFLSDRPEGNSRLYSDLEDTNHDISFKFTLPFNVWSNMTAEAHAGANIVRRERTVDTRRFKFQHQGPASHNIDVLSQSPEDIFVPENIGPEGFQFEEITRNTDNYTANQDIEAVFVSLDVPFTDTLDLSGGARKEYSLQSVETFKLFSHKQASIMSELETEDLLPALALTWRFRDDMLVRGAYAQTVNRPDFRELSPATFNDVVGGREISGNPDLQRALLTHYDLRWEWYPTLDQNLSVGFFYKEFEDPIEAVIVPSTNPALTYQNAPGAYNLGGEIEFRNHFGFIDPLLMDLYLAGNFAYIESQVDLGDEGGVATSEERPLQGQSPYVVNMTLGYDNPDLGSSVAVLYNIIGERIVEVGSQGAPDVYEEPYNQLDFVVSQTLGQGFSIKFKAKNLLDREVEYTQGDEVTETFYKGQDYSISLKWNY